MGSDRVVKPCDQTMGSDHVVRPCDQTMWSMNLSITKYNFSPDRLQGYWSDREKDLAAPVQNSVNS